MKPIQAIRGMNDILPNETARWQYLEAIMRKLAIRYGYQEIRFPILEELALFKRSVGDATDIVAKEMYAFTDRNGTDICLRPEGTAACIRAGIQNGLLYNQTQKLWYLGPMFRHERPQKGRYRQFQQWGLEAIGMSGPDIDAEMILMTARLWEELGLTDKIRLEINSLGSQASRQAYRTALVDYLTNHQTDLDEDSQRRLSTNPLRILDSKNPAMKALIDNAPQLTDYLDEISRDHFEALKELLNRAKIQYTVNPYLVRGLDYYDFTVFEWITDDLGAQGTVCAGGRYNTLIEQLGGKTAPAVGLALGLERLALLLPDDAVPSQVPHAYLAYLGEEAAQASLQIAEDLRNEIPELNIITHCGGGNLKKQMKHADKSQAICALIVGEEELKNQTLTLKYLREDKPQETLAMSDVIDYLRSCCTRRELV